MRRPRQISEGVGERAQQLFKMLVEHYLRDGHPVGSKTLAASRDITVSPATIRNIMTDLESQGLVRSPHTSAGRVPTHQGLRFFVESLISVQPMEADIVRHLHRELNPDMSPDKLVESASQLLSHVTRMAGVVTMRRQEQVALRQVEFLPLSRGRVLVILVVNDQEVQNRIIHPEREYSEAELTRAANYINAEFRGQSMSAIRAGILDSMRGDKDRMTTLMETALDVTTKAFPEDSDEEGEYVVSGESNLVNSLASLDAVRSLFDAFAHKSAIVHLLDRCMDSEGIQLFIGEESGYRPLDDYSVVTARYEVNGQVAGVLGVVGPTRMAYEKVIPVVDVTARLLGAAMDHERLRAP